MSVNGDEVEEEYESDPEDAIVPSRRREASDDEEDEKLDGDRSGRKERTSVIESDGESDGEGAPAAYEEEEVEEEEEEEVDEGAEFEEEEEVVEGEVGGEGEGEGEKVVEGVGSKDEEGGEKKENEPYAVPTAGAFYMHDDRFQSNGRGRQRRMPGGRRLWESKDDRAWVHDRFEEMNLHDTRYGEGRRNSRGRFRGRGGGRTRGESGRGYAKGNRPRGYSDDGNNQDRAPKTVRGRGPRRYEPTWKNNEVPAPQHKQSGRSQEPRSNTSGRRSSSQTSNVQPDLALPRKQVFASSLNSASPPFYPSGSSKQDITVTQAQSGSATKSVSSSMQMETTVLAPQSVQLSRGKSIVNSVSSDRPYINDSLHSVAGRTFSSSQLQSSGSPLTTASTTQSAQSSVQGKNFKITTPSNFQPTSSLSEVARVRPQIQPSFQHRQTQFQPVLRNSTHQASQQRLSIGNQVSSPPHVSSTNASEVGEPDSRSSKSKSQLVSKAKSSNQGAARGSFLYSGAQVIGASGAMGLNHKDQNFSGTPPLLPVMQFGGQHHGGLGVPAVGMALPGYVAGNSEMTWLPVLAGAAGALGASYPYIALDGNYYPHPSGQSSSSVDSSRDGIGTKPANTLKPAQKPEIVNDEFGQRQNKPRRYSEMNFGQ